MSSFQDVRFFLGSKTSAGFVSYFEQLVAPDSGLWTVVFKGGPGSGKSTLMKRAASALEAMGHRVERIPCASDVNSLDAFLDRTGAVAMVDGTSPHCMDPRYPGAADTLINAGDAWEEAALRTHRKEIIALSEAVGDCHARASAYITAAGTLCTRGRAEAQRYVNEPLLWEFAQGIGDQLAPSAQGGREELRLLSAVSVGKTEFFRNTLSALCPARYVLPDEWGAAAHRLLTMLRQQARGKGQHAIVCPCSVCPDHLEHLLLPEAGLCFTTANAFHDASEESAVLAEGLYRPIPAGTVSVMAELSAAAGDLIHKAEQEVAESKALHDELEKYYVAAMDFAKMDAMLEKVLSLLTKPREGNE